MPSDLENMARAAEYAADYENMSYDDCPDMRICNWPEIMRAALESLLEVSDEAIKVATPFDGQRQKEFRQHLERLIRHILEGGEG